MFMYLFLCLFFCQGVGNLGFCILVLSARFICACVCVCVYVCVCVCVPLKLDSRLKVIPLNLSRWERCHKLKKRRVLGFSSRALFLTLCLRLRPHSGLIDGYTGERAGLEEQLRQKEELQLNLDQELQVRPSSCRDEETWLPFSFSAQDLTIFYFGVFDKGQCTLIKTFL